MTAHIFLKSLYIYTQSISYLLIIQSQILNPLDRKASTSKFKIVIKMHHPLHLNLTKIWSVAIVILLSSPESALSEKPQPHDSIQVPHIQVTDESRRPHSLRGAKQRRLDEVEASPSSDLRVIQPRVVGGNDAPSDSYPFAAAAIYAHKYYACGATLVVS